jgi:hypothetical protein
VRDPTAAAAIPSGILFRVFPDVIVGVQHGTMSDTQWNAMVDAGREQGRLRGRFCTLVVIVGGPPPTSRQRMVLNDAIKGLVWTAAAVTDSPLIRLATTAMSWFQPGLRTYSSAELEQAMDYVAARSVHRAELGSAIYALRAELGVPTARHTGRSSKESGLFR